MQLSRRPFAQASTVAAGTSLAPLLPQGRRALADEADSAYGLIAEGVTLEPPSRIIQAPRREMT